MRPVVWLRHDEARDALAEGLAAEPDASGAPGAEVPAVALSLDDDSVYHVRFRPRDGWVHGEPRPCVVACLSDVVALEAAEQLARTLLSRSSRHGGGPAWPEGLVLFLAPGGGDRVSARAFHAAEGELHPCDVAFYQPGADLALRSQGLVETDLLAAKRVVIVGLGSGGSTVAVELAKAGVGAFELFDFDRLEPSNVARHVCGVSDLGRLKTRAVRDAVHDRSPDALIGLHERDVTVDQAGLRAAVAGADLVIGATDNRASRSLVNDVAVAAGVPALFGRALTRAAGGDVLRVRPGQGPCLACVFRAGLMRPMDDEVSSFRQARAAAPAYVADGDATATVQPGLSADIAPISTLMVKLALVELSRGQDAGISSLEADLVADFYVWANRRERTYARWSPMAFGFDKPSVLRWYGARVERDPACPVCGVHEVTGDIDPLFRDLG